MLSIIVFVNLFSRNKVLSFSFFINLFIIIFFGDDLIHYTLILFILSFCLFIFIISSNINYRYPILCKCLFPTLTFNIIVFLFFLKIFIKKKNFFFFLRKHILQFIPKPFTLSSSQTQQHSLGTGNSASKTLPRAG